MGEDSGDEGDGDSGDGTGEDSWDDSGLFMRVL